MPDNFETDSRPVLTIDLGAMVENYRKLASLAPGAEAAAAIKADAYGLGMEPVAAALVKAGVKTFFVATPEEGVALRKTQPAADIYILNGLPLGTAPVFLAHRLRPSLKSLLDCRAGRPQARASRPPSISIAGSTAWAWGRMKWPSLPASRSSSPASTSPW